MGRLPGEPKDRSLMEFTVELATPRRSSAAHSAGRGGNLLRHAVLVEGIQQRPRHHDNAAVERFWNWSEQGRLPIVIDTSPCTYGFKTARRI